MERQHANWQEAQKYTTKKMYGSKHLSKEKKKISNKQLMMHFKDLENQKTKINPKLVERK